MEILKVLAMAGAAGLVAVGLSRVPASPGQPWAQENASFCQLLSIGDRVAIDTLDQGGRLRIVPDDTYWQKAREQRLGVERGTIVALGDDYVSIRMVRNRAPDPLVPQGKTELVHLPVYAVESIIAFVPSQY